MEGVREQENDPKSEPIITKKEDTKENDAQPLEPLNQNQANTDVEYNSKDPEWTKEQEADRKKHPQAKPKGTQQSCLLNLSIFYLHNFFTMLGHLEIK